MADENTNVEAVGSLITEGDNKESTGGEATTDQTEKTPHEKENSENEKVFYGEDKKEGEDKEGGSEESADKSGEGQSEDEDGDKSGKEKNKNDDAEKGDKEKEEIKLERAENSQISDADMERIEAFAKDQGLSKEAGQKLLDDMESSRGEYIEGLQEDLKEKVSDWAGMVKTDKELGGENFDQSIIHAKTALKKFGTQELLDNLDQSGFGSHPEVVRVFSRIGKAMGSDDLVRGGTIKPERSMEDVFYGSK